MAEEWCKKHQRKKIKYEMHGCGWDYFCPDCYKEWFSMSNYWQKEWEDMHLRPCAECLYYWGNGEGCNMLDCRHRPDHQADHFQKKEVK